MDKTKLFVMTLMVTASLFVWSKQDMPQVEFRGQRFSFPEGATEEQISGVLRDYMETQPTANGMSTPDRSAAIRTENGYAPTESYFGETMDGEEPKLQDVPKLTAEQRRFAEAIAQVETGGLDNRFIRTKVKPNGTAAGSSAYGTYQITHGLLSGYLDKGVVSLTEQERAAAEELLRRQEIALTIGGRDRAKYQKGGIYQSQGVRWAKAYGFENVDEFLDAFDYGGTLGLDDDAEFQTLYESFARKMLNKHLDEAGGNPFKAARIWHGGPKGAGATTDNYERKVRRIYEQGD
ncbi:hypothetical protein ABMA70_15955 [Halobacteriovorax sp. XZX-3]|uniref:hypothetical protein n=1 Tax=Halobacteriovorax sp. XZX-3 TaxID=3157722 RepID=UPI00371CB428